MKAELLLILAVLALTAGAGVCDRAGATPVSIQVANSPGSAMLAPVRWACWAVPGSGLGRQCRWVTPGWRWRRPAPGSGSGQGVGPGLGPGPRRWIERIPGSGLGSQRVCR